MICRCRQREVKVNKLEFAKEIRANTCWSKFIVVFCYFSTCAPQLRTEHSFLDVKTKTEVLLSI